MNLLRRILRPAAKAAQRVRANHYETGYEAHAQSSASDEAAIGHGDYDVIGRTELALLVNEGLKPTDTLVDLGCGVGRLARHAIPYLTGGRYLGIDIAETFLKQARAQLAGLTATSKCDVDWVKQTSAAFTLPDNSVDMLCAFSVFTHMEHEDTYQYLRAARRVIKPTGRLVFSCWPIDIAGAADVFRAEADMDLGTRWSRIRNVVTSVDLMTEVAKQAGWEVTRWRRGDQPNIQMPDGVEMGLGQSTCVLKRAQ